MLLFPKSHLATFSKVCFFPRLTGGEPQDETKYAILLHNIPLPFSSILDTTDSLLNRYASSRLHGKISNEIQSDKAINHVATTLQFQIPTRY